MDIRKVTAQAVALAALIAACGTTQDRAETEQDTPAAFGEPRVEEREQTVVTEREVTRTETVETDLPTVRRVTEGADINRMNVEQFVALGFPQEVAESVVQYRDEYGPFSSVEDLRQISGVTPDLYSSMSGRLAVGGTEAE